MTSLDQDEVCGLSAFVGPLTLQPFSSKTLKISLAIRIDRNLQYAILFPCSPLRIDGLKQRKQGVAVQSDCGTCNGTPGE